MLGREIDRDPQIAKYFEIDLRTAVLGMGNKAMDEGRLITYSEIEPLQKILSQPEIGISKKEITRDFPGFLDSYRQLMYGHVDNFYRILNGQQIPTQRHRELMEQWRKGWEEEQEPTALVATDQIMGWNNRVFAHLVEEVALALTERQAAKELTYTCNIYSGIRSVAVPLAGGSLFLHNEDEIVGKTEEETSKQPSKSEGARIFLAQLSLYREWAGALSKDQRGYGLINKIVRNPVSELETPTYPTFTKEGRKLFRSIYQTIYPQLDNYRQSLPSS